MKPLPQLLRNVRLQIAGSLDQVLSLDMVQQAIQSGERQLGESGRLLIRKSGTEPLIRVMAEGEDESLIDRVVGDIVSTIHEAAA